MSVGEGCIGWDKHRWVLSIGEGRVSISTESCGPLCSAHIVGLGDYMETLEMPSVAVTVHMATECPAYDTDDACVPVGPKHAMKGYESGSHYIAHGTRCDCDWWPVIRPVVPVAP